MALIDKLRSLATIEGVFSRPRSEELKMLEEAMNLLRSSTCYCLQKTFTPALGMETAAPLAVAVVDAMFLEPPAEVREKVFYEKNLSTICQQSMTAYSLDGISGTSGCASYLYVAKILHATMTADSTAADGNRADVVQLLRQQAADLRIVIPTSVEICGSESRSDLIRAIYSFAKAFYYSNTWSGGNPAANGLPFPFIPYGDDGAATATVAKPSA